MKLSEYKLLKEYHGFRTWKELIVIRNKKTYFLLEKVVLKQFYKTFNFKVYLLKHYFTQYIKNIFIAPVKEAEKLNRLEAWSKANKIDWEG
jgi:hypothetical protein